MSDHFVRAAQAICLSLMPLGPGAAFAQMGGGFDFGGGWVPTGSHTQIVQITSGAADEPLFSPYETLDYEQRVLSTAQREPQPGNAGTAKDAAGAAHQEKSIKSQTKFRVRRQRIYPQIDLRHATPTYTAFTVGMSVAFEKALDEALAKRLEQPLSYDEESLDVVLREFRILLGSPLEIDRKALEEAGIAADVPLSATLPPGISLRSALRRLLNTVDLTLLIKNQMLLVTTKEKAETDLIVKMYPTPWSDAPEELLERILNTVQPPTWDTQGGPGAIRVDATRNSLWICQTLEVHEEIMDMLQLLEEPFEEQQPDKSAPELLRGYRLSEAAKNAKLSDQLVSLCNTALGDAADPAARVTMLGDTCFVHSSSRPFHVLAAETIRSINGVWIETVEHEGVAGHGANGMNSYMGGMGGGGMGGFGNDGGAGGFCWIAREVYGTGDGRWLVFRAWLLDEAPDWLVRAYATHGPQLAIWLRDKPLAKRVMQVLMDMVVRQARTASAATAPDPAWAANRQ